MRSLCSAKRRTEAITMTISYDWNAYRVHACVRGDIDTTVSITCEQDGCPEGLGRSALHRHRRSRMAAVVSPEICGAGGRHVFFISSFFVKCEAEEWRMVKYGNL